VEVIMFTMNRAAAVIAAAVLALTAACGGATDNGGTSTTTPSSAPSTEQPTSTVVPDEATLTAALLTAEDLGDGWHDHQLEDGEIDPGIGLSCPPAHPSELQPQWQVGTNLTLVTAETEDRYVSLNEYLFTSEPVELEQTYLTLREAVGRCAGEVRRGDGDSYTLRETEVTDLDDTGDQALMVRYAETLVDPPGDALLAVVRHVLVRTGATLMMVSHLDGDHAADYTGEELDLIVSDADLDGIVAVALDKLP
jgi:hypothetical protein